MNGKTNPYNHKIQQLYHAINMISKEYHKTPSEIYYDIQTYHQKVRMGLIPSTQTSIDFFLNLSNHAINHSLNLEGEKHE